MRLVLARCSVDYVGRLTAHLPEATRLLVYKADGSLLVHSDTGGYKPLMWMTGAFLNAGSGLLDPGLGECRHGHSA